ncbi:NAD-P-binding protein [Peniophora sp. CONT]|nr:NAD-P-binding protein [Peniophora sp. CONT]
MHPNPVVVVTGASRGLGLAIAQLLLGSDTAVVAINRSRTAQLDQLAAQHPDSLKIIQCSATDAPAFTKALTSVSEDYGRLDALVLNHGLLDPVARISSGENSASSWATHFDTNVFSCITAVQASLPALRKSPNGGRVIFVSSGAATGGTAGWGAYNAGKAAMNSICRTLATEEKEVISVAVRPGKVDTDMQGQIRSGGNGHMDQAVYDSFVCEHNEGKLLPPDQPGHVIAKLALSAPAALSGQFVSWDSEPCAPFREA